MFISYALYSTNEAATQGQEILVCMFWCVDTQTEQATGLDAWASRVKCPARFVSHLHEICIYI